MLEARDVTLWRGGRRVLADVSLTLPEGEVVAICGPNGAGKSSLFAVLAGELRPDTGRALLDGVDMGALGAAALAGARAVLEQAPVLAAPFTVAMLVRLGLSCLPRAHIDDEAVVAEALHATGMTALAHQPVDRLSGGEQARAHLARILAQLRAGRAAGGGRFLLLDEPTASLDLAHQLRVLRLARAEARSGSGVLLILHDLNLAANFADRIVMMAGGAIVSDGAPSEVFREDLLMSIYETSLTVEEAPAGVLRILPDFKHASEASV